MESKLLDVAGSVIDLLPSRKTQKTDWMVTFTLDDGTDSCKARFFAPQNALPPVNGRGDVVLLRKARVQRVNGAILLVSSLETSWTIFPTGEIPPKLPPFNATITHTRSQKSSLPTAAELQIVIDLKCRENSHKFTAPPDAETLERLTAPRNKFALVKDLVVDRFYDLVGQVVKIWRQHDTWVELYLTDYTSNEFIYNYADPNEDSDEEDESRYYSRQSSHWMGPFGKRTILVDVYNPHAQWTSENVKPGNFVLLRNINTKYKDGHCLQGKLRTVKFSEDRIDISVLDASNDRVRDVLRRKQSYLKDRKASKKRQTSASQSGTVLQGRNGNQSDRRESDEAVRDRRIERPGEKRKSDSAEAETTKAPLTRNQARKKRKKEKLQHKKAQSEKPQSERQAPRAGTVARDPLRQINTNIRCARQDHPARSVADIVDTAITHKRKLDNGEIITLPFYNKKSRSVVRIVDFRPAKLEDFTFRERVSEFDVLKQSSSDDVDASVGSSSEGDSEDDGGSGLGTGAISYKWTWAFDLFVEDANAGVPTGQRERMVVKVCEDDAVFLLKMDPVDLHADESALNRLREKLFLLWGDLEERKLKKMEDGDEDPDMQDEPIRAQPFSMWVQEYGIRRKGTEVDYLRNMRLTETTII